MKNKHKLGKAISLILLIGFAALSLAGCGGGTSNFIPVTGITPSFALTINALVPVQLGGTIVPANATNKANPIEWSVEDAEIVGANIDSDNKLTVNFGGEIVVIATIADGVLLGTPFIKQFEVTVEADDLEGEITIIPFANPALAGQVLTADYDGDDVLESALLYRWYKGKYPDFDFISDETNKTFTPAVHGSYTVTVSAMGFNTERSEPVDVFEVPVKEDFDITGLVQDFNGSVRPVTITPLANKSSGARTIYYEGTGGTTYNKNQTAPVNPGTYTVTFDVAEARASGYVAATGLAGGTLTIKGGDAGGFTIGIDDIVNSTPEILESGLTMSRTSNGNPTSVELSVNNSNGDYDSISWVVNEIVIGTGDTVTLYATNYMPGKYYVTVKVTIGTAVYNQTIAFTVEF
jgi:hypothetical protein